MKLKTKLLYLMIMMSIAMVMVVVGVFAVKTTTFQVGGNITFNAKGINATISQGVLTDCSFTDSSIVAGTNKLKAITINTDKTASQIESEFAYWQGLNLKFNDDLTGSTATLKFSITNNATSGSGEYILASVSVSQGTSTNATVSVTSPTDYSSISIEPQQVVEYTITFTITDTTANASLSGFAITFNLERQTEKAGEGYTLTLIYTNNSSNNYISHLKYSVNDGEYQSYPSEEPFDLKNVLTIKISLTVTYLSDYYQIWLSSAGSSTAKTIRRSGTSAEFELTQNDTLNLEYVESDDF
jgi:hypothetical protein